MRDFAINDIRGLTEKEAEISAQRHGRNRITQKNKKSFWNQYMASFGDPVIKILLMALGVNIIFMFKDFNWYEAAGIAIAVLVATLISTLSEYGSESAFEKLQAEAADIKCRVKRGDRLVEMPIGEIVTRDVVLIQAGERIPADGRLLAGTLAVDQSALNGETKEARKHPATDRHREAEEGFLTPDRLYRGSVVCEGEGVMRVEQVGDATFYGQLAAEIQEDKIDSPLKARLSHLAQDISRFGYAAAVIVALANLFNNIVLDNHFNAALIAAYFANPAHVLQDVLRAITLGITVIVMAVPEGLPMMITVVLSANMRRMLKDQVLVRKLVGIETSGSLNILFTDKTGTLTKGKLSVTAFIDAAGRLTASDTLHKNPALYEWVQLNCYYNNGARTIVKEKKKIAAGGNSTDRALLEYVLEDGQPVPAYQRGFSVPFNSDNKYALTEIIGEKQLLLIKGAPENLLPNCVYALDTSGQVQPLAHTGVLKSQLAAQAKEGLRVLALCTCSRMEDAKAMRNLTLIGFLGIQDEVRKEARAAIREVTGAGVQVVMVTGDNRDTAAAIALKAGLIGLHDEQQILTSAALNQMNDNEVKARLPELRVVARALPADKSRLVRLAQETGMVAGMTGDGVNDAPALKKADVGFAMGDGTEIAKEAADIVILDNNFASIVRAILYGRTIFKSIRKFLIFQLSINLCAVGVSVIGPFIGVESPVTVIQMLWINMIMDTLAGLAYAGEAPLAEYMKEPPKKRGERIINRYMYSQIAATGLYTTLMCLLFFKLPFIRAMFRGDEKYWLTAFFSLFIFTGVFNSLNARTYRINLFAYILKNRMFLWVMGMVCAVQLLLIYYGGTVFRTAGLTPRELFMVLLMATTVIIFDLGRKMLLRANHRKGFI